MSKKESSTLKTKNYLKKLAKSLYLDQVEAVGRAVDLEVSRVPQEDREDLLTAIAEQFEDEVFGSEEKAK